MLSFWLWLLVAAPQNEPAVYLREELVFEVPGRPSEKAYRKIYIGKDRVRTDFEGDDLRLIYDLKLGTLFVIDLKAQTYYLSRPGRDKDLARAPLWKIVPLDAGMLKIQGQIVTPTGRKGIIGGADCREFLVNYRTRYGVTTRIWATMAPSNRRDLKKIWYAASGTKPAQDVKDVFTRLFRELAGDPVRVIAEIDQEGFTVTLTSTFVEFNGLYQADEHFFDLPQNFEINNSRERVHRPWGHP